MRLSYRPVLTRLAITVMTSVGLWVPLCMAQEASAGGEAAPNVTGTGKAGHIAVWKNTTTLGNSAIYATDGNIGIGTTAPAAKLEVNGDAQVDGNFSFSGSILLTGVGALIQVPNNGLFNFSAGLGALSPATTGGANTAVGDDALQSNTTGSGNTATGFGALLNNTTGSNNTATGFNALDYNTTGNSNTAFGDGALALSTTGSFNTAIGNLALYCNGVGNNNTASGDGALGCTTGSNNTANGSQALALSTTGNNNIAIGYQAGLNVTITSNNIHIGNQGSASDSGLMRIGTAGTQTSAFIAGIYGSSASNGVPVLVNSSGQLGTISSSRRYKEDIQDMGDTSSGLMRLRPVTFRYKKAFDDGSKPLQYGLIAEEVADVYPDLVARSADGQAETVKYQVLDSMLLNELQKQNATIAAQKDQIRSLEERLARVEAALSGTTVTASFR